MAGNRLKAFGRAALAAAAALGVVAGLSGAARAQAAKETEAGVMIGPVSGLPVPRYVSLKSAKVYVRQGPTKDHPVAFVYRRAGEPVEIVAEYDNWRRIRDSEGSEGWVWHSLLSGRRTALVAPWSKDSALPIRASATADARLSARLEPKVLVEVRRCDGSWCRVEGDGFDGFIPQDRLWGVYPGERFD
ncbi:SH3 domain-containing protein [Methylopila sp. Yamaguchi]|uniref:SH3 domain-containing protein n=1 Tax=Methylopila sp. Yamaguchi TaxID=1437817 RepID=UPI000CC2ADA7|nr:SH3 domain-containing protein [Methylopila sp. Yamaguchi]GBD49908.1 aspartyl-tRNA synthetase [Methylopila sp. Yamaguchi]